MSPTDDLHARQAELLDELDGLARRASIGHDGVWENERRRVIRLELSAIDAELGGSVGLERGQRGGSYGCAMRTPRPAVDASHMTNTGPLHDRYETQAEYDALSI